MPLRALAPEASASTIPPLARLFGVDILSVLKLKLKTNCRSVDLDEFPNFERYCNGQLQNL